MTTSTHNPQLFKMSVSRFVTADTHLELDYEDDIPTVVATLPGSEARHMWIRQYARSYSVALFLNDELALFHEFVGQSCFDDLARFLSFVN